MLTQMESHVFTVHLSGSFTKCFYQSVHRGGSPEWMRKEQMKSWRNVYYYWQGPQFLTLVGIAKAFLQIRLRQLANPDSAPSVNADRMYRKHCPWLPPPGCSHPETAPLQSPYTKLTPPTWDMCDHCAKVWGCCMPVRLLQRTRGPLFCTCVRVSVLSSFPYRPYQMSKTKACLDEAS